MGPRMPHNSPRRCNGFWGRFSRPSPTANHSRHAGRLKGRGRRSPEREDESDVRTIQGLNDSLPFSAPAPARFPVRATRRLNLCLVRHPLTDTSDASSLPSTHLRATVSRGGPCVVRVARFGRHWAWWRTVGWSGREEHWKTACPPIIHGLNASHPPFGSAASLPLSRNRARWLRVARHSDRSSLWCALALALGNKCRRLTVVGGSPWREGGLFYARLEPRGISGTGQSGQGISHRYVVGLEDGGR